MIPVPDDQAGTGSHPFLPAGLLFDLGINATLEKLSRPWLMRPGVDRSTMMGLPCLRVKGAFFACVHHEGMMLLVKLPAERVKQAVAAGEALPFAPAGRVFREWVEVPLERAASWKGLLAEAHAFVSGGA